MNELDSETKGYLQKVTESKQRRDELLGLADSMRYLPELQSEIYRLALMIGWIDETKYRQKIIEAVRPIFADNVVTRTERDMICGMAVDDDPAKAIRIARSDLGVTNLTLDAATALACLGNHDKDMIEIGEANALSENAQTRESAAYLLYSMQKVSQVSTFSYPLMLKARKLEPKGSSSRGIWIYLSWFAERGFQPEVFWPAQLEALKRADLRNEDAVNELYYSIGDREKPKAFIQGVLDYLVTLPSWYNFQKPKEHDQVAAKRLGYLLFLIRKGFDAKTLAEMVVSHKEASDLVLKFYFYNIDPDDDQLKANLRAFWLYVRDRFRGTWIETFADSKLQSVGPRG